MSINAVAVGAPPTPSVRGVFVDALFDRFDALLDEITGVDLAGAGDSDLLRWGQRSGMGLSRLTAVKLAIVAEVQRQGAARSAGATSAAAWLRGEGMAAGAARRQVDLAEALLEHEQTREALAKGRINSDQASVIATAMDALSQAVAPECKAEAEASLLEQAGTLDPKQLLDAAKRTASRIDPTGSGDLERQERAARAQRELVIYRGQDGMHTISGRLDIEGAAILCAALDPLAKPRPSSVDGPDPRSAARRRGDALVDLARIAMGAQRLPASGGLPPQVVVTMTLDQLRGEMEGCAEIAGSAVGEPISASTARRIACDAGIIPAVLGGASEILDLGRSERLARPAQRRALAIRDGGCAAPGCDRPPQWTQAHHIDPWMPYGRTDLNNLVLVCDPHHDLLHHDGWTVRIGSDGRPVWIPPPEPLPA
jgi:hypothetical protein